MATKIRLKKKDPKKTSESKKETSKKEATKTDKEIMEEGDKRRVSMTSKEKEKGATQSKEIDEFLNMPGTGSKAGFSDSEKQLRDIQVKGKGYTQEELQARVRKAQQEQSIRDNKK